MARDRLSASDHLDKAALVVAFLGGAVGAWYIKSLGFGPFWAAGWTVGAMLIYVAAVSALGRLEIEPEAIGDNCYYLGFLLTLSSLSVTLYQLSQSEDQVELMRSIISGFGIALVSTIVGILLRVIFMQLRPDIVARDRQSRIELQRAARDLRLELASSVAAIKEFSTEAIQVASEQAAKITDATNAAVEAQRGRMRTDAEEYSTMLRATLKTAGEQSARAIADSVKAGSKAAQESSTASLEALSGAISDFAIIQQAALDATKASDVQASKAAALTLSRSSALAGEIDEVAKRLAASLAGITSDLTRSLEAIESTQFRIGGHERAAGASADSAAKFADAAASSADSAAESAMKADERHSRPTGLFGGWNR